MDLQLGLALSSNSAEGFDLNCSGIERKEDMDTVSYGNQQRNIKKRSFDEVFEDKIADTSQTLHLLVWGDQPNKEDDLENLENRFTTINRVEKDAGAVVGWPPINSLRKRICQQNRQGSIINCVTVENGGSTRHYGNKGNNSLFVKVKMEGVGIARKVDLSLHYSHETLLQTLVSMFGKCQETVHAYQLTFQDKEGDWQLAGDFTWGIFVKSVQRLKLLRKIG